MNDSPNLPDPPFGDATDEALSALVDGELAAFAADHDLTEATARARLEAWPGAEARLAELDRVRASMQTAVPPLDDVTRRRLVRGATNATATQYAPAPRSHRWLTIVGVAAAAILVLVGVAAAISANGGGGDNESKSSSSAASGAAAAAPLSGDVGNLGDVTSTSALRALLDRRAASSDDKQVERGPSAPAPGASSSGAASDAAELDPIACAADLTGSRNVTFSGTGSYRGAPVTILGIDTGGRTIVFVVSSTDCTKVLASISR